MTNSLSRHDPKRVLDNNGKKRIITVLLYQLILASILFAAGGSWQWWAAWVYTIFGIVSFAIAGIILLKKNPEIINERGRKANDTKPFDKTFTKFYTPLLFLMPLVAGLDYRFGWSSLPLIVQLIGFIGLVPATILPYWAMAVNDYLTTTVRIQTDRGHQVCSSGPYQYVRHPMYVGAVLSAICTPLLLGSWWALLVGLLTISLIVWRTANEDQVLQAELAGYAEYAQEVRFRLLPGLW